MKWILILVLYSSFVFAQEEVSNYQLNTSWGLGESRKVSKVAIKKIVLDGELAQETTTSEDYILTVIDTSLRTTLEFERVYLPLKKEDVEKIQPQDLMPFMIKNIELRMQCLPYKLLIDRSTGLAFEVVNERIYTENIATVISKSIQDFKPFMQDSEEGLADFKEQLSGYLKGSKKNILETVKNQLNELLEPYTYSYPIAETVEKSVVIDQIGNNKEGMGKEVPAMLRLTAEISNEKLTVSTALTYDKSAFLDYMKYSNPAFVNVAAEDLNVVEKKNFSANTKTKWVQEYSSEMLTEIPGIRIIQFNSYYYSK